MTALLLANHALAMPNVDQTQDQCCKPSTMPKPHCNQKQHPNQDRMHKTFADFNINVNARYNREAPWITLIHRCAAIGPHSGPFRTTYMHPHWSNEAAHATPYQSWPQIIYAFKVFSGAPFIWSKINGRGKGIPACHCRRFKVKRSSARILVQVLLTALPPYFCLLGPVPIRPKYSVQPALIL